MKDKDVIKQFRQKFKLLSEHLNERTRRIWAATEAKAFGYGGVTILSEATNLSRTTIYLGMEELRSKKKIDVDQIRKSGAGRKKLIAKDKTLLSDLEAILEPETRGDPESVLRWTCKSTKQLATELNQKGYRVSDRKICDLLSDLGYSLQANRKTNEGKSYPDRDAQFCLFIKK